MGLFLVRPPLAGWDIAPKPDTVFSPNRMFFLSVFWSSPSFSILVLLCLLWNAQSSSPHGIDQWVNRYVGWGGNSTYSNAVRKLPLVREPYLHVAFGAIGGYIGLKYSGWEQQLLDDVNAMRADRNMPPKERVGGEFFGKKI